MKYITIALIVLLLALPCYANEAPVFSGPIPDITLEVDEEYSLNLSEYFTDPDNDTLTFRSTIPNNIDVGVLGSMFAIMPHLDWQGVAFIIFNATDSELVTESNEVTITVGSPEEEEEESEETETPVVTSPVNRPPSLIDVNPSQSPYQMTTAGDTFFLTVMDLDGDDLTFTWILDGEVLSGEDSETFTYNKPEVGTHSLIVEISDGIEEIGYSWTVKVAKTTTTASSSSGCGDGSCDAGEDCLTCETDCGCVEGEVCEQGVCILERNYLLLYIIGGVGLLCLVVLVYVLARHFSKKKAKKDDVKKGNIKSEDLTFNPSMPAAKPLEAKPAVKPEAKPAAQLPIEPKGAPPTQFSMEKEIVQGSAKKSASGPLQPYVTKMRKLGYDDQTIANKLKEHGWKDAVIKQALK